MITLKQISVNSTFNEWRIKTNAISQDTVTLSLAIGSLTALSTNNKSSIVNALNEVIANIGVKASLLTTDKSSIVAAINELKTSQNIGDLEELQTDDKTSVIAAINETNSKSLIAQSGVNTANNNITTLQGNISTINGNISTLQGNISTINGNISDLQTRDLDIGTLTNLETEVKTNLVSAINSLKADVAEQVGIINANIENIGYIKFNSPEPILYVSDTSITIRSGAGALGTMAGIWSDITLTGLTFNAIGLHYIYLEYDGVTETVLGSVNATAPIFNSSLRQWIHPILDKRCVGWFTVWLDGSTYRIVPFSTAQTSRIQSVYLIPYGNANFDWRDLSIHPSGSWTRTTTPYGVGVTNETTEPYVFTSFTSTFKNNVLIPKNMCSHWFAQLNMWTTSSSYHGHISISPRAMTYNNYGFSESAIFGEFFAGMIAGIRLFDTSRVPIIQNENPRAYIRSSSTAYIKGFVGCGGGEWEL